VQRPRLPGPGDGGRELRVAQGRLEQGLTLLTYGSMNDVKMKYIDHLFLDRSPNIGPLISRGELDKFKNC
jgi:hypothetical protein